MAACKSILFYRISRISGSTFARNRVGLQLHNGAELRQAGVVLSLDVGIQEISGNIFELLIADCFRLDVFFAHDFYQVG
jgi:hypothetical protein